MAILNEQKHNWAWKERLFYLYSDGTIYELMHLYRKSGYNHYQLPPIEIGKVVARIIYKSKIDRLLTIQTGRIHFKKSIITD